MEMPRLSQGREVGQGLFWLSLAQGLVRYYYSLVYLVQEENHHKIGRSKKLIPDSAKMDLVLQCTSPPPLQDGDKVVTRLYKLLKPIPRLSQGCQTVITLSQGCYNRAWLQLTACKTKVVLVYI